MVRRSHRKEKRIFTDPAWFLFGVHPLLRILKEEGEVTETGLCPIIDMRKGRKESVKCQEQ